MSIVLEQLVKRYDGHPVVNNVSLEVGDGEFFVLLGSSGSGKTTILSLIAGLAQVDDGRILLHGRDVTYLPVQQRRVGFVFQNYALFQYMTVAENIEFGLSIRKVSKEERKHRRDELLELVGLSGLGDRMPRQLSGGQQQRVALARALAYHPEVLLLDEPLGALDAKIRADLRRNLKSIQRKLGIAAIFVTHDQEEAFDLADRVGIMSFGRLIEVGTPEGLYQHPQTEFVASFLGASNLMVGSIDPQSVKVGPLRFPLSQEVRLNDGLAGNFTPETEQERRVQVLFRPEDVSLAPQPEGLDCPKLGLAEVEEVSFGGAYERLRLRLPPIPNVRPISPPVTFGSNAILLDVTRSPEQAVRFPLGPGEKAWVGVHRIHALAHPGLSFLVVTDGSLRSQAAIAMGGQIARLAHARVTLLGCAGHETDLEAHLQEARKTLGGGLAALDVRTSFKSPAAAIQEAVEKQPFDLVVLGYRPEEDLSVAEEILEVGEHHLLLVPGPQPVPTHALICVSSGEPGKDDVLFAGRLMRHLGADASLMTVVQPTSSQYYFQARAERFLDGGVQTLSLLGVPARRLVRTGPAAAEMLDEMRTGGYDILVVGAPLADERGKISLNGVVSQTLSAISDRTALIVRSRFINAPVYPVILDE